MKTRYGPAAVGVGAGLIAGMFGIGGGILLVPGLVFFAEMDQRLAHGTSLGATVPITAGALISPLVGGDIAWTQAALMLIGSSIGVQIGAVLLDRLPVNALRIGFALLLLVTAARLFMSAPGGTGPEELTFLLDIAFVLVGFFTGVLAGTMGVGGGIIMVPAMLVFFDFPTAAARATSLAVILPTALVGSYQNLRHGNIDVRAAATVGGAGVVSAFLGSLLAGSLSERLSSALFGGLLIVSALRTLSLVRRDR